MDIWSQKILPFDMINYFYLSLMGRIYYCSYFPDKENWDELTHPRW